MVWYLKLLLVFFTGCFCFHLFLHLIFFFLQPLCIAIDVSVFNAEKPLQIATKKF